MHLFTSRGRAKKESAAESAAGKIPEGQENLVFLENGAQWWKASNSPGDDLVIEAKPGLEYRAGRREGRLQGFQPSSWEAGQLLTLPRGGKNSD